MTAHLSPSLGAYEKMKRRYLRRRMMQRRLQIQLLRRRRVLPLPAALRV